jgi:hypothetical protein
MSRIYSWWRQAQPVAFAEPGRVKVDWSLDGQSMTFSWGHIQSKLITLDQLRRNVITDAEEMQKTCIALVPDMDTLNFQLSDILDAPASSQSPFDHDGNKAIFEPYIKQVRAALRQSDAMPKDFVWNSADRFSNSGGRKFLNKTQKLLRQILVQFYLTCGVPPRAWQAAGFCFRTSAQNERNLRIIDQKYVTLSNPKAKQRDRTISHSFWALPPHLGKLLVFYLGVYRPIEIEILNGLGLSSSSYETHIFVNAPTPRLGLAYSPVQGHNFVYSPTNVNEHLNASQVLGMEARALRHVFTAILERHFPRLSSDIQESAITAQGQHSTGVRNQHYARDQVQRSTGLSSTSNFRQLAVSHSLHTFYGFVPHDYENGDSDVSGAMSKNQLYALSTARSLILQGDYCVGDGNVKDRKAYVKDLMLKKPYMTGKVSFSSNDTMTATDNILLSQMQPGQKSWDVFGDDALAAVTAAVMHGSSQGPLRAFAPLEGYPVSCVAMAAGLVQSYFPLMGSSTLTLSVDQRCSG